MKLKLLDINEVTLETKDKLCKENISLVVDDTNIKPENIKKDVSILGVAGTYEGSGSSEDLSAEVSEYTNKIASLESAVASLETELANKASGGSGDIETCNLMIDFSAKVNSAAIGCDIIDENGDAIGATMYMDSSINLVTIENVVCASSLFIRYNGYDLPGFNCENCYKLPLKSLSGSALGTTTPLHTFKITAPRGETAKITVYNND